MTTLVRWLLVVVVAAGAVFVPAPSAAAARGAPAVLDGFVLRHLPRGLGASTDFAYEYDDVAFVARVWESGSDAAGWRVDLDIQVLRGARLHDAQALRDWFAAYQERPDVRYRPIQVRGLRGWACADQVFWLARPGVALSVQLDRSRWSRRALLRTVSGVRPS